MESSRIPIELYRPIFEALVFLTWDAVSIKLRLVNSFFDFEILHALFATYAYRHRKHTSYQPLLNHFLNLALEHPTIKSKGICNLINQSLFWLEDNFKLSAQYNRNVYQSSLLRAATEYATEARWHSWAEEEYHGDQMVNREAQFIKALSLHKIDSIGIAAEPKELRHVALIAAVAANDMEVVKRLLTSGAIVTAHHDLFAIPIEIAIWRNSADVVDVLLPLSETSRKQTPNLLIEFAAGKGHKKLFGDLMRVCRPFTLMDLRGPLQAAARNQHQQLVLLILKIYKSECAAVTLILHRAALAGAITGCNTKLAKVIVGRISKQDLELPCQDDHTPLDLAVLYNRTDIAKHLLSMGLTCESAMSQAGLIFSRVVCRSALDIAARQGHVELGQVLIDAGAKMNLAPTPTSHGCFVEASLCGQLYFMKMLLQNGLKLSCNSMGEEALESTAALGLEPIVRFLIEECGLKPRGDLTSLSERCPYNPMLTALIHGHDHVVKTLVELGSKVIDPMATPFAEEFTSGEYPMAKSNDELVLVCTIAEPKSGRTIQMWRRKYSNPPKRSLEDHLSDMFEHFDFGFF